MTDILKFKLAKFIAVTHVLSQIPSTTLITCLQKFFHFIAPAFIFSHKSMVIWPKLGPWNEIQRLNIPHWYLKSLLRFNTHCRISVVWHTISGIYQHVTTVSYEDQRRRTKLGREGLEDQKVSPMITPDLDNPLSNRGGWSMKRGSASNTCHI